MLNLSKIELGDHVREKVTGLEGVITGYHHWLTGCDSVTLQPPAKDGKVPDPVRFDVGRVEVIEKAVVRRDRVLSSMAPSAIQEGGSSTFDAAGIQVRR